MKVHLNKRCEYIYWVRDEYCQNGPNRERGNGTAWKRNQIITDPINAEKRTDKKHDINLKLIMFYFILCVLNDSFAAKSKFLFKNRDNCECTLGNIEIVLVAQYTFHFHPVQPNPLPAAHHHQFSLKQKLEFFQIYWYISLLPFFLWQAHPW